jgi:GNAT superfamily N-acetyltransferase
LRRWVVDLEAVERMMQPDHTYAGETDMSGVRNFENSMTTAMARNLAAWTDSSVVCLGVQTFRNPSLWWRKPGGSPIYDAAIITDPQAADDVLLAALRQVNTEWKAEPISVLDCWAVSDLSRMGFERRWVTPWYVRYPSPLPSTFTLPCGLSIEAVTTTKQLAEFEQASWEGFEMPEAADQVGRFGQHAPGTIEDTGMRYLIARLNGRVVASTIAYITSDMLGIYGLSTLPEFRRRGYATALVRESVSLRSDLPVSVWPDPESVRIYTRTGFVSAGQIAAWSKGS